MPLPIAASRVTAYKIPVHVPFAIATQTLPCGEGCFVEIINDRGQVGLGEAAPFPVLTKDDAAQAAQHARELLSVLDGLSPQEALDRLATMRPESFQRSRTAYVGVESALWDLLSKEAGVPLSQLWGPCQVSPITTDITLPIMAPSEIPAFWDLFGPCGFPVVKIKVSGQVTSDLDLVMETVKIIGSEVQVTLDGNQGFTVEGAYRLVEQLARFDIKPDFFEQPLPAKDHRGLAHLSSRLAIPVCLDETVETAQDAAAVAREGLGKIINLKIMKSSIAETRDIIKIAQKSGLHLMIGGMLETEVAMGVSLQLACGTGAVTYVDLDTPFFMKTACTEDSPWAARNARLDCPTTPGHGLRLHTAYNPPVV